MNSGLDIIKLVQGKPLFYLFLVIGGIIHVLLMFLLGFSIYYLIHIGNRYIEPGKALSVKRKHFFYLLIFLTFAILVIIAYQYRKLLGQLLHPIIWSIIFAYLLSPVVHFLEKGGLKRVWAVIFLYASLFGALILLFVTITPKISKETSNLIALLPQYSDQANQFVNRIYLKIRQLDNISPQFAGVKEAIEENISHIQYYIMNTLKKLTANLLDIFSHLVGLVLIPIFSFYFLKDADFFKKKIIFLLPKCCREECVAIARDIDILMSKFIRGQLLVAAIVGIFSTLALLVIRVDFAFLIGAVAGIFNVIPYFGPIFGAIPAVVVALLDSPSKALWVIIAFTAIQQIESAILSPKIVGDSVGLHPITVILVLLIGNEWLGIVGMLFAVPIAASMKIVGKHIMNLIIRI
ncbi:AI-2E family transporter [Thermotalea metallivorans]|uniref:AI-2 transport protein TqsA n=1 Tax=Thermotalea metallivorans TaxID=520762 RepID=A0A140L0G8_9FIRM|nr:AI-2E family transporter [Thermotalea metallivorans]KXG74043.1 AI-2 transport protein TqsA [Thermotalea metallivorans]